MARSSKDLEDMSFAELTKMEQRLEKLKAAKQDEERAALKEKVTAFINSTASRSASYSAVAGRAKAAWAIKYHETRAILRTRGLAGAACLAGWRRQQRVGRPRRRILRFEPVAIHTN